MVAHASDHVPRTSRRRPDMRAGTAANRVGATRAARGLGKEIPPGAGDPVGSQIVAGSLHLVSRKVTAFGGWPWSAGALVAATRTHRSRSSSAGGGGEQPFSVGDDRGFSATRGAELGEQVRRVPFDLGGHRTCDLDRLLAADALDPRRPP